MAYKMTVEERGIYCAYGGTLTDKDVINSNIEISKTPRLSEIACEIINFNDVTEFSLQASTIRAIAEQDVKIYEINPYLKVAMVANQLVVKGFTNRYKAYFELEGNDVVWETKVFDSDEDARKWINT